MMPKGRSANAACCVRFSLQQSSTSRLCCRSSLRACRMMHANSTAFLTTAPPRSVRRAGASTPQRASTSAPRCNKPVAQLRPGSQLIVRASAADDASDKAKSAYNKTKDAASDVNKANSRKVGALL